MAEYALEDDVEHDLLEIGRYTARTWNLEQAVRYLSALENHFASIARTHALEKVVFEHRDDFRVSRCQHHYVFFVREDGKNVTILAVPHESMDLIAHFLERLEARGRNDRA